MKQQVCTAKVVTKMMTQDIFQKNLPDCQTHMKLWGDEICTQVKDQANCIQM